MKEIITKCMAVFGDKIDGCVFLRCEEGRHYLTSPSGITHSVPGDCRKTIDEEVISLLGELKWMTRSQHDKFSWGGTHSLCVDPDNCLILRIEKIIPMLDGGSK